MSKLTENNSEFESQITRRSFLTSASLGAAATVITTPFAAQAAGSDDETPPSGEFVITDVGLVSLDDKIGILPKSNIHIRDGQIIAVADTINAPGVRRIDGSKMIAMPGMCDSHWHMWNSLFKNMVSPNRNYTQLKNGLGPHHKPEDYYAANRLALTEAIDAGITSVLNYAHNVRSPEHADAEIQAMLESGLRGHYSYGGFDPTPIDQTVDHQDFRRIYKNYFNHNGRDASGRLALSMASRAVPSTNGNDRRPEDYKLAFDMGVPLAVHSGQSAARVISPEQLLNGNFVNENNIFIHGILLTERDREIILDKGASVSISFGNEFRSQRGGEVRQQAMLLLDAGANVTLSCDASSLNPASLFEQMRIAFAVVCPQDGTPTESLSAITPLQCLEWATRNGVRSLGFGDIAGTITPGKRADIVLVKADTLNMAPGSELLDKMLVHSAMRHNVDTVIADGKVLKWKGEIISVDAEQVREEAIASLYNIRKRAGGDLAPPSDSIPSL